MAQVSMGVLGLVSISELKDKGGLLVQRVTSENRDMAQGTRH